MHDVPLLEWNEELARKAKAWADKGELAHSPERQRKFKGGTAGEHVWMTTAPVSDEEAGELAVQLWYGEKETAKPGSFPGCCGHYTQVPAPS